MDVTSITVSTLVVCAVIVVLTAIDTDRSVDWPHNFKRVVYFENRKD